jgi:hypothetical protein
VFQVKQALQHIDNNYIHIILIVFMFNHKPDFIETGPAASGATRVELHAKLHHYAA